MKKSVYIWTREFPRERLQKVSKLQRVWENLFSEPGDRGHYSRYQWLGAGWDGCRTGSVFTAPLDGKECQVHLQVVTTREWFARKIYLQAVAQTRTRYPRFDERRFFDGQRIGERIIEFTSEEYDLAWGHLWTALWSIIKEEKPTVSEATIVEACSNWGYPAPVANAKQFGKEFTGNHRRITLVSHVDAIDEEKYSEVKALVERGVLPDVDLEPVNFTFAEIRDGFIELSSPELVLLNWADARPPQSDDDLKLIQSVNHLNLEGMGAALLAGANANTINQSNEPLISALIGRWRDHEAHFNAPDDDLSWHGGDRSAQKIQDDEVLASINLLLDHGAHPDLHGPGETTAITDASLNCRFNVVELLLNRGASAAIECYFDSDPGQWPQAWDSPHFDAFHENDPEARRIYDLLILNRPSPIFRKEFEARDKNAAVGIGPDSQSGDFRLPDSSEVKSEGTVDAADEGATFEYNLIARQLPNDKQIVLWMSDQGGTAIAAACNRYALALNTLDASWLDGIFSEFVSYESQSVFEKLVGRKRVMGHLLAKLESIRQTTHSKPIFDVGLQSGTACVIGFQQQGPDDVNWRNQPVANFTFALDFVGLIKSILVITVAPVPSTAKGSATYPGLNNPNLPVDAAT